MNIYSAAKIIAGVDEAGRGPLAGPVYAAAVILDKKSTFPELRDSKQLLAAQRQYLAGRIRTYAPAWTIASASVAEIEDLNILQATLLAMQRALTQLPIQPEEVLIDGNQLPKLDYPAQAVVKGDTKIPAISAASILAKEARDEYMHKLSRQYPGYGFARHKGYPTKAHYRALQKLGPSPAHRRTFEPIKKLLADPTYKMDQPNINDTIVKRENDIFVRIYEKNFHQYRSRNQHNGYDR